MFKYYVTAFRGEGGLAEMLTLLTLERGEGSVKMLKGMSGVGQNDYQTKRFFPD